MKILRIAQRLEKKMMNDLKPTFDEKINSLQNEYYKLHVSYFELTDTACFSACSIERIDSGEFLKETIHFKGKNKKEAMSILFDLVKAKINELGKPVDWKKFDPVRSLTNLHIKFKEELNSEWDHLNSDDLDMNACVSRIVHLVSKHTISVCHRLSELNEHDVLKLVNCDDFSFYKIENAHKIDAMTDLFDYVKNPSDTIILAHESHLEKIILAISGTHNLD